MGVGNRRLLGHSRPVNRCTLLLSLLCLLGIGCTDDGTEGTSVLKPTVENAHAPDALPGTSLTSAEQTPPPEDPTPAPTGWVLPKTPNVMADSFTFLGWSDDGRRYAFQNYVEAQGATCSARYEVFVVDASTDSMPEGGKLEVRHESPEGGPGGCSPTTLEPSLETGRAALLKAHGVQLGHLVNPTYVTQNRDAGLFVASYEGGHVPFTFLVRYPSNEPYSEEAKKGAGYVLTLHPEGGSPRVIEPGTRRREYVLSYSVLDAPFFVSPDGGHAALIVRRAHTAFEGTRTSYMSNGFALGSAQ